MYLFSLMSAESSTFGLDLLLRYRFLSIGFCPGLQYQKCISSHIEVLKSHQKMIGYPQNNHATTVSVEISCLQGRY